MQTTSPESPQEFGEQNTEPCKGFRLNALHNEFSNLKQSDCIAKQKKIQDFLEENDKAALTS